ncbi:MAG: D-aminoacyl-tRNA deacylase [Bacillota bacterium]|jgi:D-tyrosyl-tRNA(Tyr) deacylase|nr:D-aminoacyl-tRNA deacylase [Bacillota bacterium]MDI9415339.1 D-aminoacyl-tRNA deacylase [Bacillota bacterium]NLD12575.1 D-tyrosyl-tRNA(Tyr) deacylase [Bacillota bacterium]HCD41736.1 D-tyrosyl-tRNA(Tyr) deacylase [Bacillota bacterium]HOB88076.1 D-aminoacyl-tRNA deacylase [Bacillota bacterium]
MRAVVQRVRSARVTVGDEVVGKIGPGLVVFLGVGEDDTSDDLNYVVDKVANLRVFEDDEGKMNLSALQLGLDILVVSQFTLWGDCRRGRRPSFIRAAPPEKAVRMYEEFIEKLQETGLSVETGRFQAMMTVSVENDGPVTILLDSDKLF